MTYIDKDKRVESVKNSINVNLAGLHPTDRAEAFGELSEWTTHCRKVIEQVNDNDGVPDRSEDRPVLDEVPE